MLALGLDGVASTGLGLLESEGLFVTGKPNSSKPDEVLEVDKGVNGAGALRRVGSWMINGLNDGSSVCWIWNGASPNVVDVIDGESLQLAVMVGLDGPPLR